MDGFEVVGVFVACDRVVWIVGWQRKFGLIDARSELAAQGPAGAFVALLNRELGEEGLAGLALGPIVAIEGTLGLEIEIRFARTERPGWALGLAVGTWR